MQKLDPYLNVDPGTMNPFQHGEVFVTNDGAETDLDIGHYERFLDTDLSQIANVTTGAGLLERDRQGAPRRLPRRHRPGDPAHHQRDQGPDPGDGLARPSTSVITEIGGTVGDIESLPFLEAAARSPDIGRNNCFFLHVSLCRTSPVGELKTKPTQHSVAALRSIGIQPDASCAGPTARSPTGIKRKISLMCDVDRGGGGHRADAPSIYDIPKVLHREGLDAYSSPARPARSATSTGPVGRPAPPVHHPKEEVTVALVGKYVDLHDAYLSGRRGAARRRLRPRGEGAHPVVASDECESTGLRLPLLHDVDAICVPGGFGVRGLEGKLGALTVRPHATASRRLAVPRGCSAW
jgi:CTP synthase